MIMKNRASDLYFKINDDDFDRAIISFLLHGQNQHQIHSKYRAAPAIYMVHHASLYFDHWAFSRR